MQTKLTLRLDESLIECAKRYGQAHGKSVSQLVADYFALLGQGGEAITEQPPLTRSLRVGAAGTKLDEKAYREHLRRKHLRD